MAALPGACRSLADTAPSPGIACHDGVSQHRPLGGATRRAPRPAPFPRHHSAAAGDAAVLRRHPAYFAASAASSRPLPRNSDPQLETRPPSAAAARSVLHCDLPHVVEVIRCGLAQRAEEEGGDGVGHPPHPVLGEVHHHCGGGARAVRIAWERGPTASETSASRGGEREGAALSPRQEMTQCQNDIVTA